jgi:hypothetical protein
MIFYVPLESVSWDGTGHLQQVLRVSAFEKLETFEAR